MTCPLSGLSKRFIHLIKVLFPEPLYPIIPKISAFSAYSETPFKASTDKLSAL